jgi:hypothetical protein
LVPSGVTDDVFAGIVSGGIAYQRAPGFTAIKYAEPSLAIGDPWRYYHQFWQAHGLDHLQSLVPLEISVHVDGTLAIPLVIDNPLDTAIQVTFTVTAPDGWKVMPVAGASVAPHGEYYLRVLAAAPATKLPGWQQFTVSAQSGNKTFGSVQMRAELSTGWVAPQ